MSARRHPLAGAAADAVVFVLVDALRHDYVDRTRFLRRIAAEAIAGQLEEPFGFCPRGAYFGGLTMAEQGYTNLFRYDPVASPFSWTRELAGGDAADATLLPALRPLIVSRSKGRVPAYAATYLDPLQIPLAWLGCFDVCERESPASRRVGYRSLFHELDDRGQPWLDLSWPYPGWVGGLSSGRVAGAALDSLDGGHRFAFVHLSDLDFVGHAAGPGSRALQTALDDTDRLCELLAERVLDLHRDPVIVFAGDHGMLPVVRHVDVARPLAETGLRFGDEVAYFIDSTMVRVWTHTAAAAARVHEALAGCAGGRWLSAADWTRYELTGIDRSNGDAIFLADPGVLFTPNFFDWSGATPARGMHGYAPDVADNRGALIAWRPRAAGAVEAGVVPARALYPALQSWLGLEVDDSRWPDTREDTALRGRWSRAGTAASDAVVDGHLATVVDRVRRQAPGATAVILAGGFGRGEGTVVSWPDGTPQPVNDYDVVVVGADAAQLSGLDAALAAELGIDFVDLWPRPDLAPSSPISQFDFDLRYGATRLAGDPLALDRLRRYAPAELGLDEGLLQLGNRAAGFLLGQCGRDEGGQAAGAAAFGERQRVKFLVAIADAWLMAQEDYHASYAVRRTRFFALSAGSLDAAVRAAVDAAFAAKLHGPSGPPLAPDLSARQCAAALTTLLAALGLDRQPALLAASLTRTVSTRVRAGADWLAAAGPRGLQVTPTGAAVPRLAATAIFRAALEGVLTGAAGDDSARTRLAAALTPEFMLTAPDAATGRAAVARTWLTLFHP